MQLGQSLALGVKALHFAQQLAKLLVRRDQPIPLGQRRIALGNGGCRQGAQRINIVGKRITRSIHVPSTAHDQRFARPKLAPDSIYRSY
jgi:hypothetical protein